MTIAWAIIIVAVLFLLDKYHLLRKTLIAAAIVAIVLAIGVAGWTGWRYLALRWEEHENSVRLTSEKALFVKNNECLNLYTGQVRPVSESKSQTETHTQHAQPTEPIKVNGNSDWVPIPPGAVAGERGSSTLLAADEHWCNADEVLHERGTPVDPWILRTEVPTIPPGEYYVSDGARDSAGEFTSAARLCVDASGVERCYTATLKGHMYGNDAKVEEVRVPAGGKLLLFSANDYSGGNSFSTTIALVANRGGQLMNLLPDVDGSVEHRFWDLPDISTMPVFVNVYALVWDYSNPNECRACAHRGRVASYVYSKETRGYVKFDEFVTDMHQWLPDGSVLESEKRQIVASLQRTAAAEAARHIVVK